MDEEILDLLKDVITVLRLIPQSKTFADVEPKVSSDFIAAMRDIEFRIKDLERERNMPTMD